MSAQHSFHDALAAPIVPQVLAMRFPNGRLKRAEQQGKMLYMLT